MTSVARGSRLPLVPTLLVATLLELVVHRIVLHFLKPQILEPETEVYRLFNEGVGPVVFFFASFVALSACTWLLVNVSRDEGLFALPWRVVLGLFSCVFLPVATVGCLVSTAGLKVPSRSLLELHPYLTLAFVLMVTGLGTGILRRRGPILPRIGVMLLLVPLFLFAYFSYRTAQSSGEHPVDASFYKQLRQAAEIPKYGRLLLSYLGFWAFLCFVPLIALVEGRRPPADGLWSIAQDRLRSMGRVFCELGPLLVALAVGLAFGILVKLNYPATRSAVEAAVAYDLPGPSGRGLVLVASITLFALTVAALAWRSGPTRVAAAGLVALALAEFRLAQPLHNLRLAEPLYYLVGVVGLIALCIGIADAWDRSEEVRLSSASPAIPDDRWRGLLETLVERFSVRDEDRAEISVREEDSTEISCISGQWRGVPLKIRFGRRMKRLLSLTIVFGEELERQADWTAALAERSRVGEEEAGPERRLEIHDRAQLSDRLLGESVAERLREIMRGRVDVWLNVGLRYRAVSWWSVDLSEVVPVTHLAESGCEDSDISLGRLLALCDLLFDLAQLADVVRPVEGASESGETA